MKRLIIIVFSAWMLLGASSLLWGQMIGGQLPADIKGEVRDSVTRSPLQGVRVMLELARYGPVDETATDEMGRFEFRGLNHGMYVVRLQFPGYRGADEQTGGCDPSACRRVDMSLSSSEFLDFNLVPLSNGKTPAGGSATVGASELLVPQPARKEFDQGKRLADAGNAADSIAHFKKAIELFPSFDQAYFWLGIAYMDQKDWKQAEAALAQATKLNPNSPGAYQALGTAYAQAGDFAAAEKPLVRGLELQPDVAEGQFQLARTEYALGRFQDAATHAQKCTALKPDYAPVYLLLGNLALKKRDQAGALREYKQYLRLDPQGPYAAAARHEVEGLEKAVGAGAK